MQSVAPLSRDIAPPAGPRPAGRRAGMEVRLTDVRQVWPGRGSEPFVALDGVSHTFLAGRFSCLLGPSGCGKSTLAQIIGGLETPTSGRIDMADPADGSARPVRASVMVWQHQNLFPWRSVVDNVAFGLEMAGVGKAERLQRAERWLATIGLQAFARHYPSQLSGGMRQRVALARALIMERPVLLMDEPFGALDAQTKIVMQEELTRLFEAHARTVIFVTHSIDEAILLGDEVVVMTARPGRIKEVLEVDLPRPRTPEMMNSRAFRHLYDRAFHLIREEVGKAMAEQAAAIAARS
jgi:NitT/TauT family transport system ATP-binding protein